MTALLESPGTPRHRTEREEQVLSALAEGVGSVDEIVTFVYPRDLADNLREAASRNVRTHLQKLVEEGRVAQSSSHLRADSGLRMKFERRLRLGSGGPGCGLMAGVWLAAIGAVLISPVGEWIVKGIGWAVTGNRRNRCSYDSVGMADKPAP